MQAKSDSNLWGIDVSHWQGEIDWKMVAASGVQFAFCKATDGVGVVDQQFRRNAGGAYAVNIPVGFYHFAHVKNNVIDEIDNFCRAVTGLPVDIYYALDIEGDENASYGREKVTQWCLQWLQGVEKRTGKKCMIYTGAYFARDVLGPELGVYPIWVAQYGTNKPLDNNTWAKWDVFQYSQTGSCPGINGNVDMNLMEIDFMRSLKEVPIQPKKEGKPPMEKWLQDAVIQSIQKLASKGKIGDPNLWINYVKEGKDIAGLAVILLARAED